jgi:DNA polymerase I-like protein with 3'-5' exonuclease and polymerase domains
MITCPLYRGCKHIEEAPHIINVVPLPAKHVFLFDKIYGVNSLLSDKLETSLKDYIQKTGIDMTNVYMTSLSKCRKSPTKACIGMLVDELKVVKPERMIIFGSDAGGLLGINGDVKNNRIKFNDVVVEDMFSHISIPALVTYSIDYIYSLTKHVVYDTINLLFKYKEFYPESEYITDPDKLLQELSMVNKWSLDFEAPPPSYVPYSMAISTENKNYYIEFSDIPIKAFSKIFLLPNKKIVHSAYELKVLKDVGLDYNMNFVDTWLYSYLVDPNRDSYSLKNLVADYFYQPSYAVDFDTYNDLPKEKRRLYNVLDSFHDLNLYNLYQNSMADQRVKNLFKYVVNPFMHVLSDMNYYGVRIDESTLKTIIDNLLNNIEVIKQELSYFKAIPKTINLDSPKQLREMLYTNWKLKVYQFTKRKQPSTNHEALAQLATIYKRKSKVLNLLSDFSALSGTYGLLKQFDTVKQGGKIFSKYWPNSTATGRLVSENPNMQNIPPDVRSFIIPDKGMFFNADVSQSDIRMLAQESGDTELIKKLAGDIHRGMASIRYNKIESEITEEERKNSKSLTFGIMYGITEWGLSKQLNITIEEAMEIKKRLMTQLSGVADYWKYIKKFLFEHLYVQSMYGRRRYFTKQSLAIDREATIRQALNAPIQSDTNDTIFLITAILKKLLCDQGIYNVFNIQIHDEIVVDVKDPIDSIFKSASEVFISTLSKIGINMKLPVILEYGYGMRFGQIHKNKIWTILPDGSSSVKEKEENNG